MSELLQRSTRSAEDVASAIVQTLPGNGTGYTAIVRGVGGATGIAVVEVYALP